ncbi:arabinan endo-1,5-alpha-L-arabinosidase [Posidoniimonas polymericola]|uniref:arabinan endo-1,5-alpha-L-arabinosidase n=1 Tax=Posidoniimonas polymericola TaxID=2528002 RepID=UPI001E28CE21|nr:arabinan endo-1,5-alpha-L-arabinosidase [Posidoniimonas polymericola]
MTNALALRPTLAAVLLLAAVAFSARGARSETSAREGLLNGAPDPTGVAVTSDDGKTVYYVAATGEGVQLLRSTDLVHWTKSGRVFEDAVPAWAARDVPGTQGIWAPDLSYHDGLYYLYYSVSTFGSQHSAIGLAINKSLDPASPDYAWEDRGKVIDSDASRTDFNAIDPALLVDEDGRWWLFWGSHWAGLKVIEVDPSTGKPRQAAEILPVAARPDTRSHAIEAPFVYFHNGYYYQFVSWDGCCDGAKSTYKVAVGRSRQPTGPYVDADGRRMLDGGGTVVLQNSERWRGPGHNGVIATDQGEWMVHHTYDVENLQAQRILQVRPLTWTQDGWPKVGEPVSAP